MYKIVKYVKEHGMNITIRYDFEKDIITLHVYKKCGVSIYTVEFTMYGIESIDTTPGDLLFGNVKDMVAELERKVGGC